MSAAGAYFNMNTPNPITFRAWVYRPRLNKVAKYIFVRKAVLYLADLGWRGRPHGLLFFLSQGAKAFPGEILCNTPHKDPFLSAWCGARKWCWKDPKLVAFVLAPLASLLELGQGQIWRTWAWKGTRKDSPPKQVMPDPPRSAPRCPRCVGTPSPFCLSSPY